MAAKDLYFKIAILDETKDSLGAIKENLNELERYANSLQRAISSVVKTMSDLGKNVDIKLPNMDKFVEQINSLQSVMGKTDAFGIKSLKGALNDFGKVLQSMGDGSKMGSAMRKSVKSMIDAIPDMGTASASSLATFRDRYARILGSITEEWKKVSTEINKNGGMSLFPNASQAVLQAQVEGLKNAYKNLSAQSSDFLGAMNRAIAPTNFLQGIIDKVDELVRKIGNARASLAGKGLLDPAVEPTQRNVETIISELDKLEQQLQKFGNGNYDGVMQGFLAAVKSAVTKVGEALKPLNEINLPEIGGQSVHAQNAEQINKEAEAQKQLNEQIKAQEQEVQRLTQLHDELSRKYSAAVTRNEQLNTPTQWDVLGGQLTHKEHAAEWIASYAKKYGSKLGDFYNLDGEVMQSLMSSFVKKYKTLGNVRYALRSLINAANIDFLRGSVYNTQYGQNNAQIKIDEEALKNYRKAKRDAAEEEKRLDKETDDAYRQLMSSKAKLNQLNQQAAQTSNQATQATNAQTVSIDAQRKRVDMLSTSLAQAKTEYDKAIAASQKYAGQDLEKAKWDAHRPLSAANYELEKAIKEVFSGTFQNIDFRKLASPENSLMSGKEIYENLRNALSSGNKEAIAKAKEVARMSAITDTFALGGNTAGVISFMERISASAKKNSIDYKAAQYALEQYKLAVATAKDPKFTDVNDLYKASRNADSQYRKTLSEIFDAEGLERAKANFEKRKVELQKEQEELTRLQQKVAETQPKKQTVQQQDLFEAAKKQAEAAAKDVLSPFEEIQRRIEGIVNSIKSTLQQGLSDALNTDISGTKTIQGLHDLETGLNNLKESLAQSKEVATIAKNAAEAVATVQKNISSVSQGGKVSTTTGETTGLQQSNSGIETLVKRQAEIQKLIDKVKGLATVALEARKTIRENGGNTSKVDLYIEKMAELNRMLRTVKETGDLLGHSGAMIIPDPEKTPAGQLLSKLQDLLRQAGGMVDENGKKDIDALMSVVRQLTTPSGAVAHALATEPKGFINYARDLKRAASQVKDANTQIDEVEKKLVTARENAVNNKDSLGVSSLDEALQKLRQFKKDLADTQKNDGTTKAAEMLDAAYKQLLRDMSLALRLQDRLLSANDRRNILAKYAGDITAPQAGGFNLDVTNTFSKFKNVGADKATMQRLYDTSGVKAAVEEVAKYITKINALSDAELKESGRVANLQAEYNKLTTIYRKRLSMLNQLASAEERRQNRGAITDDKSFEIAANKYNELTAKIAKYKETVASMEELKNKGLLNQSQIQQLDQFKNAIDGLVVSMERFNEIRLGNGTGKGFDKAGENAKQIQDAQYILNATDASRLNTQFSKTVSEAKKPIESLKAEADDTIAKINKQLKGLQDTAKAGVKVGADTTNVNKAISDLEKFKAELKAISDAGGRLHGKTATDVINSKEFREATAAANRYRTELANVTNANKDLAHSENTVAQAIANATNAGRQQSQVLSDLKSMAAQYLSVWGAQQFLSDMTNITGELELQRKSLEVILGSGTAASEMYAQLRDLSQQSPYTFEDLLKAHRQLAAFGIEAKNIYGTMKSLTDIGAGLDVPVERLILAYGHTKSYGYLSGIQNRQFETAGIDLVGALSDLYNRRADAAKAKGQTANYRSRKDIFALMRKREIPFEDVEEVINDLDKPGGKFYNMQERQYDTLGGKLRNLRNNYRIMQSEMGGANRNILMGVVDTINEVTAHWEKYVSILKDVVVGLGAVKIAQLAMGKAAVSANTAMTQSIRKTLDSVRSTNYLNTMNYGHWENGRQHLMGVNPTKLPALSTTKYNTQWNEVKNLAQNKEINNLTKQRIALTNDLTKAQRIYLLRQSGIEKAQARYIAGLNPLRRGLISVTLGFHQAAMAARAFMATMATQFAIMAPIMAITELVSRTMEQTRKANELAKSFREESETNRKSAEEILNNYASRGLIDLNQGTKYDAMGMRIDTNNISFNRKAMSGVDLSSDIEEMKKKLQVLSPIYDGDLLDINKFETQEQQFEALINKIESIRRANQVQESIASDLANADRRVAGNYAVTRAFGDTFTEDMNDYMESYRNMRNDLQKEFSDKESRDYTSDYDLRQIDQVTGGALTALKNGYGLNDYREALAVYFRKIAQMSEQERLNAFAKLRGVTLTGGNTARDLYDKTANPWFGKNLDTQYRQMVDDAKEWSKSLGNDIINQFAQDPEGAVAAIMNSVNTFLASAGVTDPAIKQEIIDAVIQSLNDRNNGFNISGSYGGQNLQNEALGNLYAEALTKQQFAQYLNGLTGEMSDAEGLKVFDDAFNKIQTYIKQHNYKFAALGKDSGKSWFKGMYDGAFNSLKANSAWQKRAMKAITIDQELKVNIKSAVDIYAFAEDVQKKIKEARDRIEKMMPHIKALQVRMGINFNISASTTVAEIAKQRKALEAKLNTNKSTYNLSNEAWQKSAAGQALLATIKAEEELVNQYKKLESDLGSVKEEKKWLTDEGFKDTDEEKRQKKLEEAKRKKEAADRKADQTTIKNLESRYNAIKKVYEWYKRWYELLGNSDAAMDAAKNLVDASDIKGINLNDLKSWETYVKLLERERDAVGKTKLRLPKENADRLKQIQTNYTDTIDRGDADEFSRNQDRTASALERQLDTLAKQYDLYKKIYELTGDRDLAVRLSGRNVSDTRQSKADDYKQAIQADLDEARRSLNLGTVNLDFGRLFGMDDEKIKQAVGTMLNIDDEGKILQNNKQLALQYKAITEALKKWRDLQEQINNESVETYATLIGSVDSYGNKIAKLNEDLQETIDKLQIARNNGSISQKEYDRGVGIKTAQTDLKKFEATAAAQLYMGVAVNNMTRTQARRVYTSYIDELNKAFKIGAISAKDYADKVKKVNEQYGKINTVTSDVSAMITGGLDELISNRIEKGQSKIDTGAHNKEEAEAKFDEASKSGNYVDMMKSMGDINKAEDMSATGKNMLQGAKGAAATVAIIDKIIKTINANVQSLKALFDDIAETIETFGGDSEKFKSSTGYAFVNGFAKGSQGATDAWNSLKSGNVMGVFEGAYRSIMAWPQAFAAAHDRGLQRRIDRIQRDVSAIEGYAETISKAQERTLGYGSKGSGSIISDYLRMYEQRQADSMNSLMVRSWPLFVAKKYSAANKAMMDYYNSAGTGEDLSVYQQQYNMLVAKREDYLDMYNAENAKKNKNKDALQEYKEKIAELDDEIRYFSEDLANTLYGIDLKLWADQLGDALMTAFENGEDAADAFDDTVTSILQSLVKKMVSVGVMEPLFKRLRTNLFGEDGKGGSFNIEDPNGSKSAWMKDINEALGDGGYIRDGMEGAKTLFDAMESLANGYGNTLMNSNSATMSSSIKGITETTAELLAAYLNAIRADVSVIRQVQLLFYNNAWPEYVKQITASAQSISRIDSNVLAIRQLMSENGALFERINTLRDDLHAIANRQKAISVA